MEHNQRTISIAIVLSAIILGLSFYFSRPHSATIKVVGAATKSFESDLVKWRLTIARSVGLQNISQGYAMVNNDLHSTLKNFSRAGIADSAISVHPVAVNPNYGQQGIVGYNLLQTIVIISTQIDTVEALALHPGTFLAEGVVLQTSQLEYYSTTLSELKHSLLADATRDAYERAEEIAKTANAEITSIVSARAGVFQIREPYSTEVNDYGIFNSSTRHKDISVTVSAEYQIE